jgi:hypothetical protein
MNTIQKRARPSRLIRTRKAPSQIPENPQEKKRWLVPVIVTGTVAAIVAAVGAGIGTGLVSFAGDKIRDAQAGDNFLQVVVEDSTSYGAPLLASDTKTYKQPQLDEIGDSRSQWLLENNALNVGTMSLQLTLTSARNEPVTVLDMRAGIVERQPPSNGALIVTGSAGAPGEVALGFNLDDNAPVARTVENLDDITEVPYFKMNTLQFNPGEQQTIQLTAQTKRYFVKWEIELRVLVGDKVITQTVRASNGSPFAITAALDDLHEISEGTKRAYNAVYLQCMGLESDCRSVPYAGWIRLK